MGACDLANLVSWIVRRQVRQHRVQRRKMYIDLWLLIISFVIYAQLSTSPKYTIKYVCFVCLRFAGLH